ncbi:MAG: hypothetical protein Q8P18_21405 [Pseudomonadota bacterium]|nr:hypothetical protein [Pseudomonadota bacterium]
MPVPAAEKYGAGLTPEQAAVLDSNLRGASDFRRAFGYGTACVGVLLFLGLAYYTHIELAGLVAHLPKKAGAAERTFYAILAVRAVVAVAFAWFCYQIVRAGERMALPHWQAAHAEALLGVRTPLRQMRAMLHEVAELAGKLQKGGDADDK